MEQEDLPPSWVLRTHFSRAVYYRSDTCVGASWFDIPRRKAIGTPACRALEKPEPREKGLVCITSAPSLDAFYQQASLQPSEDFGLKDTIEGEDFEAFSFPSAITSRVCASPLLSFTKDTSSLYLSSPNDKEKTDLSEMMHSLQRTSDESLYSKTLPRRSLSHNNLLWQPEGMQISASKASTLGGSASKFSLWVSPRGSPVGTPKGSPTTSQENSPRYNSNSTNTSPKASSKEVSRGSVEKRDMIRALSWSDHLSHATGTERAVLSTENWMIDLSQLLLGERFASSANSRIYHGIYQDTPVAVKIIRQPDDDESLGDRLEKVFMQEVNTLSCLQHQNVVKFIAACKKPPVLCVITEYLPGGSLRAFLHKREGELLPIPQVLQMALDIAYGMEYLHKKGVVHRDLKSENLVLGKDGCVKILDFGVSCLECDCNSDAHDLGTYRWMAPEMLSQKPYTRKVDVYSFGIVLWELLTAHLPYEEMGAVQAAFCVIHQNTRPPIPPHCPAVLRDLMCRCWSTEPEDRPEFWEILRVLNMCIDS